MAHGNGRSGRRRGNDAQAEQSEQSGAFATIAIVANEAEAEASLVDALQAELKLAELRIAELEMENEALEGKIEATYEQGREDLAKLEKQLEFLREELAEARLFTHLPRSVRIERVGRRTKLYCNLTGLQLHEYTKAKYDMKDNESTKATITFEADLTDIQFLKEQLDLLDSPGEANGEQEAADEQDIPTDPSIN